MDAFETVVATILEREGFWVRTSFKVNLSKEEKRVIDRPSSPRWEIDVVAYRPLDNQLLVVECKSFLDSRGVSLKAFDGKSKFANRFKLFNEPQTREVVFSCLVRQLLAKKSVIVDPHIQLCLAAGKIVESDLTGIRQHFDRNKWLLFEPDWFRKKFEEISSDGYENSVSSITAKLICR